MRACLLLAAMVLSECAAGPPHQPEPELRPRRRCRAPGLGWRWTRHQRQQVGAMHADGTAKNVGQGGGWRSAEEIVSVIGLRSKRGRFTFLRPPAAYPKCTMCSKCTKYRVANDVSGHHSRRQHANSQDAMPSRTNAGHSGIHSVGKHMLRRK